LNVFVLLYCGVHAYSCPVTQFVDSVTRLDLNHNISPVVVDSTRRVLTYKVTQQCWRHLCLGSWTRSRYRDWKLIVV